MGESSSQAVPRSDAELMAATAAGDAAAYVALHERHMPAARHLARRLLADQAEAEQVLADTFSRVHGALRRGEGPAEALRPYLLTAVRRVAYERRSGEQAGAAAAEAEIPDLGEPLFIDQAAAELESSPLARAFMSLPERQRAAVWLTQIEQADPGQAAALLGLTEAGLAELAEQACAALGQAYLKLYLDGLTRAECKAEADQLGPHLDGATRGPDERTVQRHLRGCRECRAVAVELTGLGRSLRRAVAPIFLGPAAAAYLSAVEAKAAPAGQAIGGLRWMGQAPRRIRQAPRQQQVLAGGVLLVAAFAVTGLSLTLAANTGPSRDAQRPVAAAVAPPSPAAAVPSSVPAPAPTRPAPAGTPVRSATPAPAQPASPAPASPAPTPPASPAPTPAPSPSPLPSPPPHRRHRHPAVTAR